MKEEKVPMNIVPIRRADSRDTYVSEIIEKMNPLIYNRFGCIILQVTNDKKDVADVIVRRVSYAGLELIKEEIKKEEIMVYPKDAAPYLLKMAWEIRLEKINELLKYERWKE